MIVFLEKIEILIDHLILHLPSDWFIEAPFLSELLSNPNGRYVLTGMLLVTSLIVFWIIFLAIQVLFGGGSGKIKPLGLQNVDDQKNYVASSGPDGFRFFKRNSAFELVANNEETLKKIEKEMLRVRKQYVDGNMLKDVYVAETRRLYNVAKRLKS